MSEDTVFSVWVNPLQFLEADEPLASALNQSPSIESLLKFLCTPTISSNLANCVTRYQEINTEQTRLFIAPAEERILEKLVWPLRHAKASYTVGNYLGTISLCGMVIEMVAILLFEISELKFNDKQMSPEDQIGLFGSSFEKLSQERRVKVLRAYGIIDQEMSDAFELIRLKRRKYLHLWSQNHASLSNDAIAVFNAAMQIVVKVLGQDIRDGKIFLNPAIIKYLEQSGVQETLESNA